MNRRIFVGLAVLGGVLVAGGPAVAAGLHGRVGVLGMGGPGGKDVERVVARVLGERGYRVIVLDEKDADAAAVARRLKLNGVVGGKVVARGRLRVAQLALFGRGGAKAQAVFSARGGKALEAKVERDLWKQVAPLLEPPAHGPQAMAATQPPPTHQGHAARPVRPPSGGVGNP